MRLIVQIALAASLTGCAWFGRTATPDEIHIPPVEAVKPPSTPPVSRPADLSLWPAIPDLQVVAKEIVAASPKVVQQAAAVVERSADNASVRDIKEDALYQVVRMSAWAMGLGFLVFLLGGFLPFPGIRTAGGWTVALGAAIATLAPWLNDLLGTENARIVGWFAFALLAFALAGGAAWWFLDKVRDAAAKEG